MKIKFVKDGKEIEADIPESDFKHFEEKYEAKKVGGSAPKRSAKRAEKKEEPKEDK